MSWFCIRFNINNFGCITITSRHIITQRNNQKKKKVSPLKKSRSTVVLNTTYKWSGNSNNEELRIKKQNEKQILASIRTAFCLNKTIFYAKSRT